MARANYSGAHLAFKAAEVAMTAPYVMGMRIGSAMLYGPDSKENDLMVSEKQKAFSQGGMAMATAFWQAQWTLWFDLCKNGAFSFNSDQKHWRTWQNAQSQWASTTLKGLNPVHKTVTANAKRLAKKGGKK